MNRVHSMPPRRTPRLLAAVTLCALAMASGCGEEPSTQTATGNLQTMFEHDFYFELTMNDVWVWDVYRSDRFVKSVRVLTFKDVNVEVRGDKDLELPKELALDE